MEKTAKITNVVKELRARGLIEAEVGGKAEEFLAGKRKVYLGIDPTADSLHLGHLVPIILMKHLSLAGHEVVFLVGGGTGMIGDPRESGERVLLDTKMITKNKKAVGVQLTQVLGDTKYKIFDNYAWLSKLTVIEFLRDVGKHFTVNQLIKRDIIKRRLDTEGDSISYTEFSYSLLQGYDFLYLNQKHGVDMQVGGSDQWANIISGVDLIRRTEGKSAYALTTPIITDKKTGKKFGKSEGNAVWLDPKKTSPYAFYQFWLGVSDEGVEAYLKIFTFISLEEITKIVADHRARPNERVAQKRLALAMTTMIHGKKTAESSARVSEILFGDGSFSSMSKTDLSFIQKEVPMTVVPADVSVIDALVLSELAPSKGEARRLIEQKGISLNETTITDVNQKLTTGDFPNNIAHLRRGKKVALLTQKTHRLKG